MGRGRSVTLAKLIDEFPERRDDLVAAHQRVLENATIAIGRATERRDGFQGSASRDARRLKR
jgi:hypothetical protein